MVRKITALVFVATATMGLCLFLGAHWTLALSAGIVATSIKAFIIKRQQRKIVPLAKRDKLKSIPATQVSAPPKSLPSVSNEPVPVKVYFSLSAAEIKRRAVLMNEVHAGQVSRSRYTKREAQEYRTRFLPRKPRDNTPQVELSISKSLNLGIPEDKVVLAVKENTVKLGIGQLEKIDLPALTGSECVKAKYSIEAMKTSAGNIIFCVGIEAEAPQKVIREIGVDRIINVDLRQYDDRGKPLYVYSGERLYKKVEETISKIRKNFPQNILVLQVCDEWQTAVMRFRLDAFKLKERFLKDLTLDQSYEKAATFQMYVDCVKTIEQMMKEASIESLVDETEAVLVEAEKIIMQQRRVLKQEFLHQTHDLTHEEMEKDLEERLSNDDLFLYEKWRDKINDFKKQHLFEPKSCNHIYVSELKDFLIKLRNIQENEKALKLFESCFITRFDTNLEGLKQSVSQYHARDRVGVISMRTNGKPVDMALTKMDEAGKARYLKLLDENFFEEHTNRYEPLKNNQVLALTALTDLAPQENTSREKQLVNVFTHYHSTNRDDPLMGVSLVQYARALAGKAAQDFRGFSLGFSSNHEVLHTIKNYSNQLGGSHCEISVEDLEKNRVVEREQAFDTHSSLRVFRCTDAQVEVSEGWKIVNAWHEGDNKALFEKSGRAVSGMKTHEIGNKQKRFLYFEVAPTNNHLKAIKVNVTINGEALLIGKPVQHRVYKNFQYDEISESNPNVQTWLELQAFQNSIAGLMPILLEADRTLKKVSEMPFESTDNVLVVRVTAAQKETINLVIAMYKEASKMMAERQSSIRSIANIPLACNLSRIQMMIEERMELLEDLIENRKPAGDAVIALTPTFLKDDLQLISSSLLIELTKLANFSYQPADRSLSAVHCAKTIQELVDYGFYFHGSAEMAVKLLTSPSDFPTNSHLTNVVNVITECCWNTTSGTLSKIVANYLNCRGVFRASSMQPFGEFLVFSYVKFYGKDNTGKSNQPCIQHILFQIDFITKKFILAEKDKSKCQKKSYASFHEVVDELLFF